VINGNVEIIIRIAENVPPHINSQAGFTSAPEYFHIIAMGHLRYVALDKDIPPDTELLADYPISRSCFHPSGCKTSKMHTFAYYQHTAMFTDVLKNLFKQMCHT
jgi:hypothetical protein